MTNKYYQKGVSLIIVFLMMTMAVAMISTITTIVYNLLRSTNRTDTATQAQPGANNIIEYFLFKDKNEGQIANLIAIADPSHTMNPQISRGACGICQNSLNSTNDPSGDPNFHADNCIVRGPTSCDPVTYVPPKTPFSNPWWLFATVANANPLCSDQGTANGCDLNICNNCFIYFEQGDELHKSQLSVRISPDASAPDGSTTFLTAIGNIKKSAGDQAVNRVQINGNIDSSGSYAVHPYCQTNDTCVLISGAGDQNACTVGSPCLPPPGNGLCNCDGTDPNGTNPTHCITFCSPGYICTDGPPGTPSTCTQEIQ